MTERKWTKGKWSVKSRRTRVEEAAVVTDDLDTPYHIYVAQYCDEADAHLIAASPEMYEALEALVDLQNGPPLIREQVEWNSAMDRARAALAKARGET